MIPPLPARRSATRRRRFAGAALALTLTALALAGCGSRRDSSSGVSDNASTTAGATAATSPAVRAFGLRVAGARIGRDFLGLSFEAADVGLLVHSAEQGNLVALLRSLGPGVLRIGGTSADTETAWARPAGVPPVWAKAVITPADLTALARLAAASDWSVLLTVNLGRFDPAAAAEEVRAAQAALGSRLLGVSIANEPEHFVGHRLRAPGWSSRVYRGQVAVYRAAIARAAPGVALYGPDAVSLAGSLGWVQREAAWEHPTALTAHYYPLGRCGAFVPTIADLLSSGVRRAESEMLALAEAVQRRTRIPLRIDETNNVACGGQPGVSDTFAGALWALDYLARAMASDVHGINLHGLITRPAGYAPLAFDSVAAGLAGRLSAHPEYYALLLARHVVGDRALRGRLAPAGLDGSVHAYARPDGGIDVIAVNEAPPGAAPIELRLPVPGRLAGALEWRLTSPGPAARTGVRLAGRSVAPDGTFAGAPARLARPRGSVLRVRLAADSAALVELRSGGATD